MNKWYAFSHCSAIIAVGADTAGLCSGDVPSRIPLAFYLPPVICITHHASRVRIQFDPQASGVYNPPHILPLGFQFYSISLASPSGRTISSGSVYLSDVCPFGKALD